MKRINRLTAVARKMYGEPEIIPYDGLGASFIEALGLDPKEYEVQYSSGLGYDVPRAINESVNV